MKLKIKSPIFIPLVMSLVFVILIYTAYRFGLSIGKSYLDVSSSSTALLSPTLTPTPADTSLFGEITWYSQPKKIPNPNILTKTPFDPDSYTEYELYDFSDQGSYEVAQFSSGAKLIVAFMSPKEFAYTELPLRFIKTQDKYYLVTKLIDTISTKDIQLSFDEHQVALTDYPLDNLLLPPDSLNLDHIRFLTIPGYEHLPNFLKQLKNYQFYSKTDFGPLLFADNQINPSISLYARVYYLQLPDFTIVPYYLESTLPFTDNQIPLFKFLDGSDNSDVFETQRFGCGFSSNVSVIGDLNLIKNKIHIGNSGDVPTFRIEDLSNKLLKFIYEQYQDSGRHELLSLEEFATENTHIIFQEKTGDWVVLVNPEFGIQAECGKPVIYLYPPKETQVTVKIGADVTQSEPHYPSNGWTVLAQPNGQLHYQNQTYPNLFWEGTGHGLYPSLGNYGFVVTKDNLVSTIKNHLSLQGLNQNEIQDFMEFWEPKLPTTPYTRLTWLTTADMNRLAPLKVTPVPNTVIRAFLDFKGLNQPIQLIPQKFITPIRDGFTLVEWGGLLLH